MKEIKFSTPEKGEEDKRDTIELPINGEVYFAYRPSTNSIALFYSGMAQRSVARALLSIQDFLKKTLEPEAFVILEKAVEDEAIQFEDLVTLAQDIIAEFAENPPTSSAASSGSRATTGAGSTGSSPRKASTRVSSPSRASVR